MISRFPFTPGRTDATQDMTMSNPLPFSSQKRMGSGNYKSSNRWQATGAILVDKAHLLSLSATEMTVLVGGLRALKANHGQIA